MAIGRPEQGQNAVFGQGRIQQGLRALDRVLPLTPLRMGSVLPAMRGDALILIKPCQRRPIAPMQAILQILAQQEKNRAFAFFIQHIHGSVRFTSNRAGTVVKRQEKPPIRHLVAIPFPLVEPINFTAHPWEKRRQPHLFSRIGATEPLKVISPG